MRKIFLLLALVTIATFSNAQSYPGIKLYGYKQAVSGGAPPSRTITEGGQQISTAPIKPRNNYWMYLVMPGKTAIKPTELFLNGKRYRVQWNKVDSTKVTFTNEDAPMGAAKSTILVPQTSGTIISLTLAEAVNCKPTAAQKKLLTNELVVGYVVKGKKYYTTLKNLSKLQPAFMQ